MTNTTFIRRTRRVVRISLLTAALSLAACNFDITNQNAPTDDQLKSNPSKLILSRAASGIFANNYTEVGADIQIYTIYGREGYNLLGNDPRETGEAISGPQDPGGRAGGNWFAKYQAIRTINTYLTAVDNTVNLSAQEKSASLGFAQTMKGLMFLRLAVRSGTYGLPIDVDRPIDADPAPFVTQDSAFAYASSLFDSAKVNLQAAGTVVFPFPIAPGFESFSTPAEFLTFNRALKARAEVFRATFVGCGAPCWTSAQTALTESFLTRAGLPGSLSLGAYYGYSTSANEPQNPITEPLTSVRYFVHPSLAALVQTQPGGAPDERWATKTVTVTVRPLNGVSSTIKPVMYNQNTIGTTGAGHDTVTASTSDLGADIAIIKNEELLLLSAEVNLGLGNKAAAIADIDSVRIHSGGLAATTLTAASPDTTIVTEILYNRLMSLLWEQGVRWIDARRYGRLASLPLDRPGDAVFPSLIVPAGECDARGLDSPCTPPVTP
jgi:starch-binding outer membrane protein, SusD/RagB family